MLGAFFAAHETDIDGELLDAPHPRVETVDAKGLTPVSLATLGEILGLGSYDDLVDRLVVSGRADDDDTGGVLRVPSDFRDALADVEHVDSAARRWSETEEMTLDEWSEPEVADVLREVSALAQRARREQRGLWYWWSL